MAKHNNRSRKRKRQDHHSKADHRGDSNSIAPPNFGLGETVRALLDQNLLGANVTIVDDDEDDGNEDDDGNINSSAGGSSSRTDEPEVF